MKKTIILLAVILALTSNVFASGKKVSNEYDIPRESIRIRDPFIYTDNAKKVYYMVGTTGVGFKIYESRDLENWTESGFAFDPSLHPGFWGKTDFWAPDLYRYKGKYYIFGTFSEGPGQRGTSLLVSKKPQGPYKPLANRPTTPEEWMCLDGSLYIDEAGDPWMLYCHEWVQTEDGEIVAQRMTKDLTRMEGDPVVLFKASEAPWSGPIDTPRWEAPYVTDAPVVIKTSGGLTMIWSSFDKDTGKYVIGQCYSESGNVLGPWVHDPRPLNNDDGGHAMIFRDLEGRLMISYHAPNSVKETPVFRPVSIDGNGRITID